MWDDGESRQGTHIVIVFVVAISCTANNNVGHYGLELLLCNIITAVLVVLVAMTSQGSHIWLTWGHSIYECVRVDWVHYMASHGHQILLFLMFKM